MQKLPNYIKNILSVNSVKKNNYLHYQKCLSMNIKIHSEYNIIYKNVFLIIKKELMILINT